MDFLQNIFEFLESSLIKGKNKECIKSNGIVYSYENLNDDIENFYMLLVAKNIVNGAKIGIKLDNCYEYIVVFLACSKANNIIIPVNSNVFQSTLNYMIDDCEMNYLISDLEFNCSDNQSFQYNKLERKLVFNELNCLNKKLFHPISKDISVIIYTSGSTGKPKGVMLSTDNLINSIRITVKYLNITNEETILALLPFTFDYGMNQFLSAIYTTSKLIIKYPYLFREIPKILEQERVTALAGVPSLWINLCDQPNINKYNYSLLKYITNSGDAIPESYLDKLSSIFSNTNIYLMYGLTECFRCTYLSPEMYKKKKGSIGKAIPESQVYLLDENNKLCVPGQIGEIVFRGPTVAMGYLNENPEKSNIYRKNPFNEYYHEKVVFSGDLAYADDDGYLFFVGRKDNLKKVNGFRITESEIASAFYESKLIHECVAVIKKNESTFENEIFIFFTVANKSIHSSEIIKKLFKYSHEKLPIYMQASKFICLENIPKLYNQKYDYKALQFMIEESDSSVSTRNN